MNVAIIHPAEIPNTCPSGAYIEDVENGVLSQFRITDIMFPEENTPVQRRIKKLQEMKNQTGCIYLATRDVHCVIAGIVRDMLDAPNNL